LPKRFICFFLFFFLSLTFPALSHEVNEDEDSSDINLQEFILEIGKYKDPFVPLIGLKNYSAVSIKSKMKLEGILWSPVNPLVVINGEILGPGDEIEGAVVERIDRDRVFLSYNNKTFSLIFWEMEGKTGGNE